MTECIDPGAVQEGDLLAYLEGEAGERVREHVERCSACADEVARLRETSRALMTLMYRADCPAPEVLGQYQMDLLPSSRQLGVAAHVRTCRHCARELEELAGREGRGDSLARLVLDLLQDVVQTVEATMVPRGRPQPAGVRGVEDKRPTLHFHADAPSTGSGQAPSTGSGQAPSTGSGQAPSTGSGQAPSTSLRTGSGQAVDVLVGLQSAAPASGTRTLVGSVVQAEAVSGGRVWLFQEGKKPISSPVDHLGTFTFEALPPGEYDLALEVGRKALLMRGVVV